MKILLKFGDEQDRSQSGANKIVQSQILWMPVFNYGMKI